MMTFTPNPFYRNLPLTASSFFTSGQLLPFLGYFAEYLRLNVLGAAPPLLTAPLFTLCLLGFLLLLFIPIRRWLPRFALNFTADTLQWTASNKQNQWEHSYTDILYVTTSGYGQLVLQTRQGPLRFIGAFDLQAPNTTVLAELERHLPPNRFAPRLRQRLHTVQWADVVGWGLLIILAGAFLYAYGLYPLWRDQFTWPRLYGANPAPGELPVWPTVKALNLDPHNQPLFVTGANEVDDPLVVWHATPQGWRTWRVEPPVFLGDEETSRWPQVQGVFLDAQGYPQLLLEQNWWVAWNGTTWQAQSSPIGPLSYFAYDELVVAGPDIWLLGDARARGLPQRPLIHWNPTLNVTTTLTLPNTLAHTPFAPVALTTSANQQLLILAQSEAYDVVLRRSLTFTSTAPGGWELAAIWPADPVNVVQAFAQTPNGDVWLWVNPTNEVMNYLRHYNAATATWRTYSAPAAVCCEAATLLVVDKHQRLWLYFPAFLADQITVLQFTPAEDLRLLASYTAANSNAVSSNSDLMRFSPDGRLWAWGRTVVWADTTRPQLPGTIPDPLTFAAEWWVRVFAYAFCLLVLFIVQGLNYVACRLELATKK